MFLVGPIIRQLVDAIAAIKPEIKSKASANWVAFHKIDPRRKASRRVTSSPIAHKLNFSVPDMFLLYLSVLLIITILSSSVEQLESVIMN